LNAYRAAARKLPAEPSPILCHCFWCGDRLTGKARTVCSKKECGKVRRWLVGVVHRYGITREQYLALWREQGGVCAICCRPPRGALLLSVDHDHVTGHIKGLLCQPCNVSIGLLRDDPKVIRRAAEYVARTRQTRLLFAA